MGILIKNGHILNPPTGTDEVMDLYVEGDRVILTKLPMSVWTMVAS